MTLISSTMSKLLVVLLATCTCLITVQAVCEQKYSDLTPDHTACSTADNSVDGIKGIDDATKIHIVDYHNLKRKDEPAKDMLEMYWDPEAAMIAQKHAEKCVWGHEDTFLRTIPDKYDLGQNIGFGYPNWTAVMHQWNDEKKDWEYGVGAIASGHVVGHFTQMVWAQSNKLGCGYAKCNMFGGERGYYVCNYGPMGNSGPDGLKKPYVNGQKMGNCPDNQNDGLCDCGADAACYHTGTLNVADCKCQCPGRNLPAKPPWIRSDHCEILCSERVQQGDWCNGYPKSMCIQYSNFYTEYCPLLCKDTYQCCTP